MSRLKATTLGWQESDDREEHLEYRVIVWWSDGTRTVGPALPMGLAREQLAARAAHEAVTRDKATVTLESRYCGPYEEDERIGTRADGNVATPATQQEMFS